MSFCKLHTMSGSIRLPNETSPRTTFNNVIHFCLLLCLNGWLGEITALDWRGFSSLSCWIIRQGFCTRGNKLKWTTGNVTTDASNPFYCSRCPFQKKCLNCMPLKRALKRLRHNPLTLSHVKYSIIHSFEKYIIWYGHLKCLNTGFPWGKKEQETHYLWLKTDYKTVESNIFFLPPT